MEVIDLRQLPPFRAARLLNHMLATAAKMNEEVNAAVLRSRAREAISLLEPRLRSAVLSSIDRVHLEHLVDHQPPKTLLTPLE